MGMYPDGLELSGCYGTASWIGACLYFLGLCSSAFKTPFIRSIL